MPALLVPPINVRAAPPLDPPFDDERSPAPVAEPAPAGQPVLPLDWSAPRGAAPALVPTALDRDGSGPRPPVPGRPGPPGPGRPGPPVPGRPAPPVPGRPGQCSPAQGATMHFLSRYLEVLNGYRPAAQLRPLIAPAEFDSVVAQIDRALRRAAAHARRAQAGRAVRPVVVGPARAGEMRLRQLKLHICEPRPGVAEAAAVLGHGDRAFAVALRLERRPAGWMCVVAQVV